MISALAPKSHQPSFLSFCFYDLRCSSNTSLPPAPQGLCTGRSLCLAAGSSPITARFSPSALRPCLLQHRGIPDHLSHSPGFPSSSFVS